METYGICSSDRKASKETLASEGHAVQPEMSQRWRLLDRDGDGKLNSSELWLSFQCQAEFLHSIGMLDRHDALRFLWCAPEAMPAWETLYQNFPKDFFRFLTKFFTPVFHKVFHPVFHQVFHHHPQSFSQGFSPSFSHAF